MDIANITGIANIEQSYSSRQNIAECGRLQQNAAGSIYKVL
jgi:hypothetical protein